MGKLIVGTENKVILIDKSIIKKEYSVVRKKYDGESLFSKYQLLYESDWFNYIKISEIDSSIISNHKTIESICYGYIEGNPVWNITIEQCKLISEQLNSIHSINVDPVFKEEYFCFHYYYEIESDTDNLVEDVRGLRKNNAGFVHGDFHLGNILWQDNEISGIIDWDNCHFGNIMLDIACIRFDLAVLCGLEFAISFFEFYKVQSKSNIKDIFIWDIFLLKKQQGFIDGWYRKIMKNVRKSITEIENNYNKWIEYVNKNYHLNNSKPDIT